MEILLLIFFVVFLIMVGSPIGFTLLLVPVIYILMTDAVPLAVIPSLMFNTLNVPAFAAIPLFMLTGELMGSAQITDRLLEFSQRIVGRMRGGLAQTNILVSMFFAGINGSVVADTTTIGSMVIPAMKRAGYPASFAAGITAVSGTIGGIIPPSIPMIILAAQANISIGGLFAAGIIPGILIGLALMATTHVIAVRRNFERSDIPFSFSALGRATLRASLAFTIPVMLVWTVLGGIASIVEAGAITSITALLIGIVFYRSLGWRDCHDAFIRAAMASARVFIILAAAGPFTWLLVSLGAVDTLENWLLGFAESPWMFVLVLLILIMLLGMILDVAVNIIVLGPMLIDVAVQAGYPDIQAGLIVIVGFLLGTVTPPIGSALYITAEIGNTPIERIVVAIWPYLLVMLAVLLALFAVPSLSMFLPTIWGFAG